MPVHTVTTMLESELQVCLTALDFSKAFDVARPSTLLTKHAKLPSPDNIYGCLPIDIVLTFRHPGLVAERLRRRLCNQKITGSNPASGHLATPFRKEI